MMPRTPMTREGHTRLQQELDQLKRVERPAIIKAIAEARAHGDLTENAEYHAARERQGFIEARIRELEAKVGAAEVIEPPTGGDRITFGSTVRLEDEDGKEVRYQIVGSDEADPAARADLDHVAHRPHADRQESRRQGEGPGPRRGERARDPGGELPLDACRLDRPCRGPAARTAYRGARRGARG